jgi:hypothetical protein
VRQICDRGAVLDRGELVALGTPGEAVRAYRETLAARGVQLAGDTGRDLTGAVRFTAVSVELPDPERPALLPGEPLVVRTRIRAERPVDDVVVAMELHDHDGYRLLGVNTDLLGVDLGRVDGNHEVVFRFGAVPLLDGEYAISLGIHTHDGGTEYDHRDQLERFSVMNPTRVQGRVHFDLTAEVRPG